MREEGDLPQKVTELMTSGTLREPGGRPTELPLGGWFLRVRFSEGLWPLMPLNSSKLLRC